MESLELRLASAGSRAERYVAFVRLTEDERSKLAAIKRKRGAGYYKHVIELINFRTSILDPSILIRRRVYGMDVVRTSWGKM